MKIARTYCLKSLRITVVSVVIFAALYCGAQLTGARDKAPELFHSTLHAVPEGEVLPGMVQSYSFTMRNSGEVRATNVKVRAHTDPRIEVLSVTGGRFHPETATAHWLIDKIEPGSSVTVAFMGRVSAAAEAGKTIDLRAYARSDETSELEIGTLTTRIGRLDSAARGELVTFQTVNPKIVRPGGVAQFHIIVHNDGQKPAEGIVARELLPRELELVADSIHPHLSNFATSNTPDLSYDPVTGRVEVRMDRLMPGEWMALMFDARVRRRTVVGREIAAAAVIEARLPNFKTSAPVQVKIAPAAAFGVDVKVDKSMAAPGDQLTYTITVTNPDAQQISKLKIVNKLPKELLLVAGSAKTSCGLQVVEAGERGQVIWKKGTLPAAPGNCTVSFKATVANGVAGGSVITNTAMVKSPGQKATGSASTSVQTPNTASVDMMDNFFAPKDLTVPPGTVITWTHRGNNPHTVTGAPCLPIAISSDGQFPAGLRRGETFSFTVAADTKAGTVIYYFCRFHGAGGDCRAAGPGMAGSVSVR